MSWWVYIIRAENDSLYTGITTDIERRFCEHSTGRGAKYFNRSAPKKVVYREACANRSEASQREYQIKQLSRTAKLKLIK